MGVSYRTGAAPARPGERDPPWRRQIRLSLLVSILSEILDILRTLYGRSVPST